MIIRPRTVRLAFRWTVDLACVGIVVFFIVAQIYKNGLDIAIGVFLLIAILFYALRRTAVVLAKTLVVWIDMAIDWLDPTGEAEWREVKR